MVRRRHAMEGRVAVLRSLGCLALIATASLSGCNAPAKTDAAAFDATYAPKLMQQLLDAKAGDVITLPEGRFSFERGLSLKVDGVTIRGAGMDKTILSFRDQAVGAEGLLVNASDFTIENLAIEDAKGDALKVNEGRNIVIRNVRTEWTGGPKTENGAYGIYPVQVENLLLEGCIAIGASDAGIYVGQSKQVIVRNNRAERNVAGIEVENSVDVDVYGNTATGNTGGILVFNMPNLKVWGGRTRVFKNTVTSNNTANFGHKGTPVASIPAGSGVVINSNDQVEVFDNDIGDNKTANVIISSVYSTGYGKEQAVEGFDPYPEAILVTGNRFAGGGESPDGMDLQALRIALFGPTGRFPDVLWDGFADAAKMKGGVLPAEARICIDNGAAQVLNADGPGGFKKPKVDAEGFRCALPRLPAISLAPPLTAG
jgi:parallel beta-helix repeat protein